jgi:hypothetical protein
MTKSVSADRHPPDLERLHLFYLDEEYVEPPVAKFVRSSPAALPLEDATTHRRYCGRVWLDTNMQNCRQAKRRKSGGVGQLRDPSNTNGNGAGAADTLPMKASAAPLRTSARTNVFFVSMAVSVERPGHSNRHG